MKIILVNDQEVLIDLTDQEKLQIITLNLF